MLELGHLARVVLLFEIKLLLELVDFDLKLDTAFALKVICLEKLQLQ